VSGSSRAWAVLSCDVDTVDRHLQGYGFEDLPPCDLVYRTAVPRVRDALAEIGAPGVFFTIARDAESQRTLLRDTVAAGHEIASHSLTHPQPFRTLTDEALRTEIETSRLRLAEATGTDVVGFRAPAWDADARVLGMVREAGYRYDASIMPTPAMLASRIAAYRRSTGKRSLFSMDVMSHAFGRLRAHRLGGRADGLVEFPIAVTRWLRFPVYHTLLYFVPRGFFLRALDSLLRTDAPVCYEFHAADLLDLAGDSVDPRMSRHPGMSLSLDVKRGLLREVLQRIASARRILTYRQALDTGLV